MNSRGDLGARAGLGPCSPWQAGARGGLSLCSGFASQTQGRTGREQPGAPAGGCWQLRMGKAAGLALQGGHGKGRGDTALCHPLTHMSGTEGWMGAGGHPPEQPGWEGLEQLKGFTHQGH